MKPKIKYCLLLFYGMLSTIRKIFIHIIIYTFCLMANDKKDQLNWWLNSGVDFRFEINSDDAGIGQGNTRVFDFAIAWYTV